MLRQVRNLPRRIIGSFAAFLAAGAVLLSKHPAWGCVQKDDQATAIESKNPRASNETSGIASDNGSRDAKADGDDTSNRAEALRSRISELVEKLNQQLMIGERMNQPAHSNSADATAQPITSGKSSPRTQPAGAPLSGSHDVHETAIQFPDAAIDPIALARVLVRMRDYSTAVSHLRMIATTERNSADRLMAQYLLATCLRKNGDTKEAALLYREIANSKDDDLLADCAHWHLNSIRWREQANAQLEQLRQRRQALEKNR